MTYYVPDDNLYSQILERCQKEERSVSQWTYLTICRALSNENNNTKNELRGALGNQPKAAPAATEEPVDTGGDPVSNDSK